MKLTQTIHLNFYAASAQIKKKVSSFYVINGLIILFQFLYIYLRFTYINDVIPFWLNKPWGDLQLAPKTLIYLIPLVASFIFVLGALLVLFDKFYIRYLSSIIWASVTFCNLFLTYSLIRIVHVASIPFPPLINPLYLNMLSPFLAAFFTVYFVLPYFIDYAHRKKLVTNPFVHSHPAMVLREPSARGGGFIYAIVFLFISILYVGFQKYFLGIYLSVFMLALLGLMDDFQNTHPTSDFRLLENPLVRLILLVISVTPVVLSGIIFDFINNPLGGLLFLKGFVFSFGSYSVPVIAAVVTIIWIVWLMNVLSWSNGIDGQYGGIVGIASLFIVVLALRFNPLELVQTQTAILAAISAGAAFGFTKYTWHPSKIMWGFGAMTAGLILGVLSISVQAKIVVSILIILIPFMDAFVTVIRRIFQRKNPLVGDRGHLHHLLLDHGWSPKKIATFYWLTTVVFGMIGLLSPEKYMLQVALIVSGIVAFFIILLNLRSVTSKDPSQQTVK